MVDRYDHDIATLRETRPVIAVARARSGDVAAAMKPDHDRAFLPVIHAACPDVEEQAVLAARQIVYPRGEDRNFAAGPLRAVRTEARGVARSRPRCRIACLLKTQSFGGGAVTHAAEDHHFAVATGGAADGAQGGREKGSGAGFAHSRHVTGGIERRATGEGQGHRSSEEFSESDRSEALDAHFHILPNATAIVGRSSYPNR